MTGGRRDKGVLELQVLAVLAARGGAMTAREVQAALGEGLAYTTVMTTLSRLYDKGALTREPVGRAFGYRVVGDTSTVEAAQAARRMRHALEAGSDHARALQHFVSELSSDDERVLSDLLRELDRDRRPDGDER